MKNISALLSEVEKLSQNTPNGRIIDSDTILADIMDDADFQISGISQDIFNIWKNSNDKKAVEDLFEIFTEVKFEHYLSRCINEMSTQNITNGKALEEAIRNTEFGQYICHSLEEAEFNNRKKNIVIMNDLRKHPDVYLTYKHEGKFGEFVCWVEDEFEEDPNIYQSVLRWIEDVYSRTDEKISENISLGRFPWDFSTNICRITETCTVKRKSFTSSCTMRQELFAHTAYQKKKRKNFLEYQKNQKNTGELSWDPEEILSKVRTIMNTCTKTKAILT